MEGRVIKGIYEIKEFIGKGGMARVYLAWHRVMEKNVAVKVINPHLKETDDTFVKRFLSEARIAYALRHPNIAAVYDLIEEDGELFMVMEYVEGKTLKQLIEEKGQLLLEEVSRYLNDIAEALDYIHADKLIHRDVNCRNIIIRKSDNRAILMDFGIAKTTDSPSITQTGIHVGTAEYTSPEQAYGMPATHKSDIYSLGVVVYEMLTGSVPFKADSTPITLVKHMTSPVQPPSNFRSDLPDEVERSVLRALAKNPDDRYSSAGSFANAFYKERRPAPESVFAEPKGKSILPAGMKTDTTVTVKQNGKSKTAGRESPPKAFETDRDDRSKERSRRGLWKTLLAFIFLLIVVTAVTALHATGDIDFTNFNIDKIMSLFNGNKQDQDGQKKEDENKLDDPENIKQIEKVTFNNINIAISGKRENHRYYISPQEVSIVIEGPSANIGKIKASDINPVLDVSRFDVSTGRSVEIPKPIIGGGIRVVRVNPSEVTLRVALIELPDISSRIIPDVPVKLTGESGDYSYSRNIDKIAVEIEGPKNPVDSIKAENLQATINVSGYIYESEYDVYYNNLIFDGLGEGLTVISIKPESIKLDVRKKFVVKKTIRIDLEATDKQSGYSYTFEPSSLTITLKEGIEQENLYNSRYTQKIDVSSFKSGTYAMLSTSELKVVERLIIDRCEPGTFNLTVKEDKKPSPVLPKPVVNFNQPDPKITTGNEILNLKYHTDSVLAAVFSDNRTVISVGRDNAINTWEIPSGTLKKSVAIDPEKIDTAAISPNGRYVATSNGGEIRIWDPSDGSEITRFIAGSLKVSMLKFSPNSSMLASLSTGTVRVFKLTSNDATEILNERLSANDFDFTSDSSQILYASSGSRSVKLINLKNKKVSTLSYEGTNLGDISSVDASREYPSLNVFYAAATEKGNTIFWNVNDRKPFFYKSKNNSRIRKIIFSPVNLWCILVDDNNRMFILNFLSNPLKPDEKILNGHTGTINDLSYSSDGQYFASASSDKTVKIWKK
jgi:serine/threonine protein kinase/WD40 repeat protein